MQIAASIYARVGSMVELSDNINHTKEQMKENRSRIVEIDKERKFLAEQIKCLETFQNTKDIHKAHENAKDKESFLMENETELILYEGAANRLSEMGIIPSDQTLKDLKEKYKELENEKEDLKAKNDSLQSQLDEMLRQQAVLTKYFGIDTEKEKEKERKRETEKHKKKGRNI